MLKIQKISFNRRINLQRFAEGDDGGQGADPAGNQDNQNKTGQPDGTDKTGQADKAFKSFKTEDEFNSWFDSAYDKRFSKSAETLKAKWQEEQNDQKSYDKMTDAEKAAYDLKQSQAKLDEREKAITAKENRADITNQLAEDGLPVALAKAFEPAFSDTDNLKTIYKAVTDGFRSALKAGVDKALAGSSSVPGATGSGAQKSSGALFAEKANKDKQVTDNIWKTTK
ncbi:MAG: DUF4355 domain-containing protein [Oenococcus sp.]|uniref:DUF4355 domain-containing protein n=1 Tax=Oenococcus sp. TaxID=1979414 RepID=UPI0039EC187E